MKPKPSPTTPNPHDDSASLLPDASGSVGWITRDSRIDFWPSQTDTLCPLEIAIKDPLNGLVGCPAWQARVLRETAVIWEQAASVLRQKSDEIDTSTTMTQTPATDTTTQPPPTPEPTKAAALAALLKLAENLPREMGSDWDGTNHYELTSTAKGTPYWWWSLTEIESPLESNTCETDAGKKLGLIMDIAATVSNLRDSGELERLAGVEAELADQKAVKLAAITKLTAAEAKLARVSKLRDEFLASGATDYLVNVGTRLTEALTPDSHE